MELKMLLAIKRILEILRAENANFTLISVELQVNNIAYDQKLIHSSISISQTMFEFEFDGKIA